MSGVGNALSRSIQFSPFVGIENSPTPWLTRLSRFEGYEDTKYLILLIATSVGLHYTVAGGVTPAVVILGGGWAGSSSASFCKSSFSSGLGWV